MVYARIINNVDKLVFQEAINDWQLSLSVEKRCLLNIGQNVTDVLVCIDSIFLPVVNSCRDCHVKFVTVVAY